MPVPLEQIVRGAVCLALYPFTHGFPLERVVRLEGELLAQLDRYESIESVAATIRPLDPPAEIVAQVKLRRVLVLQSGSDPARPDVVVARINSIGDTHRARSGWYGRLLRGEHPVFWRIGQEERHGTSGKEAYVNPLSIMPVQKMTLLRRTGCLDQQEMRMVSERLVTALELDISGLLGRKGKD
jgi:hypothetical protein